MDTAEEPADNAVGGVITLTAGRVLAGCFTRCTCLPVGVSSAAEISNNTETNESAQFNEVCTKSMR
mgnify:CR=1 FL=1